MRYNGVEITRTKSGQYMIKSPYNGTTRIFDNKEYLKNYIDNYVVLESHAEGMRHDAGIK